MRKPTKSIDKEQSHDKKKKKQRKSIKLALFDPITLTNASISPTEGI